MRKLVLSILAIFFTLPAFAGDLECTLQTTAPSELFVQAVMINHPDLDDSQRVAIAHMYELAYNQNIIADDKAAAPSDREFAERTVDIALRLGAIQMLSFNLVPDMQDVVERMRAEEDAGLIKVSAQLEPDVRQVARTGVAIALAWGELSKDITQLSADRFIAVADSGNVTVAVDSLQRTMCVIKSTMGVMRGALDFFPIAMQLAYVEKLRY